MRLQTLRPGRAIQLSAALFCLCAVPVLADGIQHEFGVSAGETLKIFAEGASIDIQTGASNRARIDIRRNGDSEERILRDYDIDVSYEGGRVVLEADRRRMSDGFFGLFKKSLHIDVVIPREFDVELKTSGGSIEIAELQGTVEASTSGGSLRFDTIDGEVNARTSGGSITIEECTGNTTVITSGGSIRVNEVRGALNASTSGGSVKAYISEQPGADSKLTTSGGSVTVYLGKALGVDLDARTSGGRVRTDFEITVEGDEAFSKNRISAALNGGGPELKLRTSGGSIQVLKR